VLLHPCIKVCHNRRIARHKTFKDIAQRAKTSVDWFYGFKLHLIINDEGELVRGGATPQIVSFPLAT